MKKLSTLLLPVFVVMLTATYLPNAAADALVSVSSIDGTLIPDPVTIGVGQAVFWTDGDGAGPYDINGNGWSTSSDSSGIQFNSPGSYPYSASSAVFGTFASGTVDVLDFPIVTISSPTNNVAFAAPAAFTFSAAVVIDPSDTVSDVQFWVETNEVADVTSTPYTTNITGLAAGSYTLTAIVTDIYALTGTNSITITVTNPGPIRLSSLGSAGGKFAFSANGLVVGKTNVVQSSSNLLNWVPVQTNVASSSSLDVTNPSTARSRFFRVMQLN